MSDLVELTKLRDFLEQCAGNSGVQIDFDDCKPIADEIRSAHARIEAQAALIAGLTEAAETLADCYVGNVDAYRTAGFYQNPEKEAEVVELRAVISKAKEAQK